MSKLNRVVSTFQFAAVCFGVAFSTAMFATPNLTRAETPPPIEPEIVAASPEAERSMSTIKIPKSWQANLFAAEPDVANPVAFHVDFEGRMFVCETFRQAQGVEDNRKHMNWVDDDIAAQTVEDRLAYIRKHLKEKADEYTKHDERVRLLRDTDSDGKADKSTVFADHFNTILSGTGAGVLSYRDEVYYTCIPDLWLLRDTDGDDVADQRNSLHYGYGVRFTFRGHDSHGLIVGPDGRLYFSIGDRGFNIDSAGELKNVESGSVLRCELDGSNLEIFATGLRNPQELAFDDYGNLFTGDNNSDSGDKARWVYVVEGGDTGWRMAYQYLDDRGPFNREQLWHPFHDGQAAYIIPPIENIADGPSGLTYYPGTGLGEDFRERFFLCDFRGQSSNSGIRTFRNKAKGAFFELVDSEQPVWNALVTDADFGPDGSFYISDWVNGWEGMNKGRIVRFIDSDRDEKLVQEVKKLLADGMTETPEKDLISWLGHVDRRVRQEAQFELVRREKLAELIAAGTSHQQQLGRIHAIWGIGQYGRTNDVPPQLAITVRALLADDDAEIRAQAARLAGDLKLKDATPDLISCIGDENARVSYFATMAIGNMQIKEAIPAFAEMLDRNQNVDPILRHGGIMAIAAMNDPEVAHDLSHHDSAAVRLATTVALRRMRHASIVHSLQDQDPQVVLEAARAIHDLPMNELLPELARMVNIKSADDALLRRIANANFRLGGKENLGAVISLITREDLPASIRADAVSMLADWSEPSSRDRVLGMWRPIEVGKSRSKDLVVAAVRENLGKLLNTKDPIRLQIVETSAALGISEVAEELVQVAENKGYEQAARADAIHSLETLKYERLNEKLALFANDPKPAVRNAALDVMSRTDPEKAILLLEKSLASGDGSEQQAAFKTIGAMNKTVGSLKTSGIKMSIVSLLTSGLEKLIDGSLDPSAQLDLLLAAEASDDPGVQELVAKYQNSKPKDDLLAPYSETLFGGDAKLGSDIFYYRTDVSCLRCHRIDGGGGGVGPDLSEIGVQKERQYLLESIVLPSKTIAKGFETVIVDTIDGLTLSGIVTAETEDSLTLIDSQAKTKSIPKADIDDRYTGASGMPDDIIKQLSREDLRNLIEFLSQRKTPAVEGGHEE